MRKGRFFRSWIFSPKFQSKVGLHVYRHPFWKTSQYTQQSHLSVLSWFKWEESKVETVTNVLCSSPFDILQSVTTKQYMRGLLSWGLADVWNKSFSLSLVHPTVWLLGEKILLDRHYKVSYQVCFLHSPRAGQEKNHRSCSSEFPKPTRSTWNWSCSWQSDKIALCRKWLVPCWQAYRNKILSWGTCDLC